MKATHLISSQVGHRYLNGSEAQTSQRFPVAIVGLSFDLNVIPNLTRSDLQLHGH